MLKATLTIRSAEYPVEFTRRDHAELAQLLNALLGFDIINSVLAIEGIDSGNARSIADAMANTAAGMSRDEAEGRMIATLKEILNLDQLPTDWLSRSGKRLSFDSEEIINIFRQLSAELKEPDADQIEDSLPPLSSAQPAKTNGSTRRELMDELKQIDPDDTDAQDAIFARLKALAD